MNKGKETGNATKYVRVEEIAALCECSISHAYKLMKQLNDELEAQGFITTAGRVSRKYLMERLYM